MKMPVVESVVKHTAGVCGGQACIGDTRIMVWIIVSDLLNNSTHEEIIENYPQLSKENIDCLKIN